MTRLRIAAGAHGQTCPASTNRACPSYLQLPKPIAMPMPVPALHTSPSPALHRKLAFPGAIRPGRSPRNAIALASRRDRDSSDPGGRLVDEDMTTLRRRIREVQAVEGGGLAQPPPPPDWAEWETRHYEEYVAEVCEAVGVVQAFLVRARPSLGIGLVALLLLSVPTSVFLVSWRLVEAANSISSTLHLS